MTPVDKIVQGPKATELAAEAWELAFREYCDGCGDKSAHQRAEAIIAKVIRQAIADAIKATGAVEAAQPFANYACSEPHVGEPECANCVLRTALTQLRALTETNKETKE